ncbi:MAG: hypothetical protein Q9160_006839 [Pyrenula sp. 1 TL-2023]
MDNAVTLERNGDIDTINGEEAAFTTPHTRDAGETPASPLKRKRELSEPRLGQVHISDTRSSGTVPIKAEFLIHIEKPAQTVDTSIPDDDNAEAFHHVDRSATASNSKKHKKSQGQNKSRSFGKSQDQVNLCRTRAHAPELSPTSCPFGEQCKLEHNLRRYLKEHKREDLATLGGKCPTWVAKGFCPSGWKCRFVGSHSKEVETKDGVKELVLLDDEARYAKNGGGAQDQEDTNEVDVGVRNILVPEKRILLTRRKVPMPKAEAISKWVDRPSKGPGKEHDNHSQARTEDHATENSPVPAKSSNDIQDNRAQYSEPPLLPSEKRRLYFGPETPVLAPLTTQGNLPFRRLCTSLGAQFTYSEMAMSVPLIQGSRAEWALMKAHESELAPPTFTSKFDHQIVNDYDQGKDLRFGAQIAGNKPWNVFKATEALTSLLPGGLRVIDLNCGCPIDLVYREGAGSALMDRPNQLEKMLRGMNLVSNEVPISVKIRMGTKDHRPTAQKLIDRLVLGSQDAYNAGLGPSGVAAIALHGRSRQQRYTRKADWEYIAECAALIQRLNATANNLTDTIRDPDPRTLPSSNGGKPFFLGNGDCYSHTHYNEHIAHSGVSTVMLGRGALMKPWIFEEIAANQYLDKSASERLGYIEQFVRNGLEAWGSDEIGVGNTRRFLLEWLSFTYRYVPVGLLEVLPPNMQERPPAYRGRNELETLLASGNYKDWIKISEMFLGPAHADFKFEPKHKSNSYEAEG